MNYSCTPAMIRSCFHIFSYLISCTCLLSNAVASDINADSIKNHIFVLGDDQMQGRATGTAGAVMASEYIAAKLKQYGIGPAPNFSEYFQQIPMHGSRSLQTSRLTIYKNDSILNLHLGMDYLMYKTGAETFMPRAFPIVFVGYGIVAPEYDYNDYLSVDVENKIVIFLEGEPESEDERYFEGPRPTIHSLYETKQRIAISRGARGSIFIPLLKSISWEKLAQEFSFEDVRLAYAVSSHLSIVINPDVLPLISDRIAQICRMEAAAAMGSFYLDVNMQFTGKFEERDFLDRNVIGFIPGRDRILKDRCLILSAHYDHLGIGPAVNGDSIYNGVSDNASGTAVLLELARVFSALNEKPKRSLIFLFLTGEEKGLLGSTYYTENPVVPLYRTIANINIDGAPMTEEFNDVVAIGSEYSTLEDDLKIILKEIGITLSSIPDIFYNEAESLVRSDQFAFARAGIPSVLLVEGLHYKNTPYELAIRRLIEWNLNIYHSPFDDLHQPMNFTATLKYVKIIFHFAEFLANQDSEPEWREGVPFSATRIQNNIEKR